MDAERIAAIRARLDRDAMIDTIADEFGSHPMLLRYSEPDRMLIAGALAVAAVRSLPVDDLADLLAEVERLRCLLAASLLGDLAPDADRCNCAFRTGSGELLRCSFAADHTAFHYSVDGPVMWPNAT